MICDRFMRQTAFMAVSDLTELTVCGFINLVPALVSISTSFHLVHAQSNSDRPIFGSPHVGEKKKKEKRPFLAFSIFF